MHIPTHDKTWSEEHNLSCLLEPQHQYRAPFGRLTRERERTSYEMNWGLGRLCVPYARVNSFQASLMRYYYYRGIHVARAHAQLLPPLTHAKSFADKSWAAYHSVLGHALCLEFHFPVRMGNVRTCGFIPPLADTEFVSGWFLSWYIKFEHNYPIRLQEYSYMIKQGCYMEIITWHVYTCDFFPP